MGAHAYYYFVPYREDIDAALQALRQREFRAGRYNPVMPFIDFPIDPSKPAPGAQHASIDDAREEAAEDGTRSILDIDRIGDEPDFCVAAPVDEAVLEELYGTTEPTHDMIESELEIFEHLDRGQAIYIIVYRDGQPDELFFAGYSFD
jgi:hypothetical protein